MAEPWFEPNTFGAYFGAIVGGVGGGLGGILGAVAGTLAPRGIGRRWVLGAMVAFLALGLALLGLGGYAYLAGQPFGIWFFIFLCGLIFTLVLGSLIPVIRMRYDQAEARKMEAAALRDS